MANQPRALIIGPDSGPEAPFPLYMKGPVVSGFGRGSKELGIPTANIPVDSAPWIKNTPSGVYFGYASLYFPPSHPSHPSGSSPSNTTPSSPTTSSTWVTYPMVMSIGYNPFYKNTVRSAEVHVLHKFSQDFYGAQMALKICGFIRPEYDYVSKERLIEDIEEDCSVAKRSLAREGWRGVREDPYLRGEEEEKGQVVVEEVKALEA